MQLHTLTVQSGLYTQNHWQRFLYLLFDFAIYIFVGANKIIDKILLYKIIYETSICEAL